MIKYGSHGRLREGFRMRRRKRKGRRRRKQQENVTQLSWV